MALKQIARYYTRWDLENHNGRIALFDSNNEYLDNRTYKNPEEFQVIVGMLRNEKHLWFDTNTKHLRTGFGIKGEPTVEEET
ncbi:MAG: hypothetical protein FP814_07955 [Desulfobacterium sp.]|nr:hypothetical protein [Desulfobacterium sp.]MBU3947537.1 hypothetical protein [Pseudomonadota bacterium]MBU4035881.1 hypothetical protein [Pseudomonadota bacterium]